MYPPSDTRSPWNFSRVCSRWRALSISLPALWSNFIISSMLSPSGIDALAVQLKRSDPYPLTISVMTKSIDVGVLRLLVENSSRWQILDFQYLSTEMIQALNEIPGYRLPELRSLRLRLDRTINRTTQVFENSPKLREVFIHGDVHELLPFPLQQLTRLRIGITRTPHRLASARNLRELTLHALPETPDNPIELPVRMLVVDRSSILDSLLLPELEDLCILGECPRASALIRRSECHLQRLTLEYRCTTEEGIAMLEALPDLHELHWEGDSVIFSRMAIPVSPAPDLHPLVPKLRSMSLFHYQPFRDETITDLMESRRRSTVHATLALRVLDLTNRFRDIEVFDIEKDFRRRGIDVEWFHGDFADRRYREYLRRYP
ncbi:hypothetical protein B0H11DRAFT_1952274 [Mycena galericulata]|nr:hypothetical protein B0H11DRAFT_1952274 [Mycena galericulata]